MNQVTVIIFDTQQLVRENVPDCKGNLSLRNMLKVLGGDVKASVFHSAGNDARLRLLASLMIASRTNLRSRSKKLGRWRGWKEDSSKNL